MGRPTIATRLAVEGEKEYKSAIKTVNSELNTLKSELKLVESQFKGQANSYVALEAKGKTLASMYETQEQKLTLLKKGLSDAAGQIKGYGKQIDEAKKYIADCEAALADLGNEAGDTSEKQKELEESIKHGKKELEQATL